MILYNNIIKRKNEESNVKICSSKMYIKYIENVEGNGICTYIIYINKQKREKRNT